MYDGGHYGITSFRRGQHLGSWAQVGCHGVVAPCTPVAPGLVAVFDLAVTPNGAELTAGAHGSESVTSFLRNPVDGTLALRTGLRGCLARTGSGGGCLTLPLLDDDHHVRLAMDPSGLRLYVASRAGMLATITRDHAPVCASTAVDTAFNTALAIGLACGDANGDIIALEKGNLPAKGQLGELVDNASVFYSPFANVTSADTFTFRAVTPFRGVAGEYATISINVNEPVAPGATPLPGGIDSDRDGFFAGQDCNDTDAAIRPGAPRRSSARSPGASGASVPVRPSRSG